MAITASVTSAPIPPAAAFDRLDPDDVDAAELEFASSDEVAFTAR